MHVDNSDKSHSCRNLTVFLLLYLKSLHAGRPLSSASQWFFEVALIISSLQMRDLRLAETRQAHPAPNLVVFLLWCPVPPNPMLVSFPLICLIFQSPFMKVKGQSFKSMHGKGVSFPSGYPKC